MRKSTVTWLLPVKNGMPYLRETLASLEAQTFRDFEVLAWDNGSTDGTIDELRRWIPSRLPGRIVVDQPLGLGASLAEMVNQAQTDLCARIDADDVNLPERLEQQIRFLESHPEVAIVGTQMTKIDESGRKDGLQDYLPLQHDDIVHRMLDKSVMIHPTVLFRRQAVIAVGNYRDVQPIEDRDLWMRLAVKYKLANLESRLLNYRVHKASTTQQTIKRGIAMEVVSRCFVKNAPDLFGCSDRDARLLRSHRSLFLLPLLLRIAHHLSREQGGTILGRLGTDSFQEAAKNLTHRRDVLTRLFLACFSPTPGGKLRDMRNAVEGGVRHYFAAIRRRISVR